jgi:hypothetical protein
MCPFPLHRATLSRWSALVTNALLHNPPPHAATSAKALSRPIAGLPRRPKDSTDKGTNSHDLHAEVFGFFGVWFLGDFGKIVFPTDVRRTIATTQRQRKHADIHPIHIARYFVLGVACSAQGGCASRWLLGHGAHPDHARVSPRDIFLGATVYHVRKTENGKRLDVTKRAYND